MDPAPLPFTLRQAQYVLAVAETRNFRRAAALCHVAQPSLSAQVAALEEALGARLFERDRRGVLPTPAGEAFLARAARILLEAREAVLEAARFGDPLRGPLRLGVIPTVGPYLLPRAAPLLEAAFPGLRVLWTEDRTAALVSALQEGRLEGAVLALEADLGDLAWAEVGRDPLQVAVARTHPLARRRGAVTQEALEGERVLLLDEGQCLRDQVLKVCRGAGDPGYRATSLPTLVQLVAGGAGITLLPALAAPVEAGHAAIALRPLADPAPYRTLAVAWRRGSHAAEALGRLARALAPALPGA